MRHSTQAHDPQAAGACVAVGLRIILSREALEPVEIDVPGAFRKCLPMKKFLLNIRKYSARQFPAQRLSWEAPLMRWYERRQQMSSSKDSRLLMCFPDQAEMGINVRLLAGERSNQQWSV